MSVVVSDAFTNTSGTLLSTHNANWAEHSSYTQDFFVSSTNTCRPSTSSAASGCWYRTEDPGDDSYDVYGDIIHVTNDTVTSVTLGFAARIDTAAITMYFMRYNPAAGQYQLFKIVAGAATSLGTPYSPSAPSSGQVDSAKLSVYSSGATRVEVFVGGVSRITSGDTAITARGKGGLRQGGANTGSDTAKQHIDNFTIANALSTGNPWYAYALQ